MRERNKIIYLSHTIESHRISNSFDLSLVCLVYFLFFSFLFPSFFSSVYFPARYLLIIQLPKINQCNNTELNVYARKSNNLQQLLFLYRFTNLGSPVYNQSVHVECVHMNILFRIDYNH